MLGKNNWRQHLVISDVIEEKAKGNLALPSKEAIVEDKHIHCVYTIPYQQRGIISLVVPEEEGQDCVSMHGMAMCKLLLAFLFHMSLNYSIVHKVHTCFPINIMKYSYYVL